MAILNYSSSLSNAVNTLNSNLIGISSSDDNYLKLIFTGDKHIISHGIDYLADFTYLNGRGLFTKDLIADSIKNPTEDATSANKLITSGVIYNYLMNDYSNAIKAAETMRFCGMLKENSYIPINGTETSGFPTSCLIGDTYRVIDAGVYGGHTCEPGDILICIKDSAKGDTINSATYWASIQNNIGGTLQFNFNGEEYQLYASDIKQNVPSLFAPTSSGTNGFILTALGGTNAPVWTNPSNITVGIATKANKVANSLVLGNGLGMYVQNGDSVSSTNKYDGSIQTTISLSPATYTTLGGIIADSNTITIGTDGKISLTKQNVIKALGFEPGHAEAAVESFTITLGESNTTSNDNIVNPYLKLISLITEGGNTTDSLKTALGFVGTNGVVVQSSGNTLQIQGESFTGATSTTDGTIGMVPAPTKEQHLLFLRGDGTWKSVPTENTWRPIKIGNTSIGDATLVINPSSDVCISYDTNIEDGEASISFGLSWYNIDTKNYETVK